MDDVARLAGVSKQTVSRVLNDNPAVRPETREAVLEAMRTLGYRPSRSARSLASGRTRMLGVISFDAARYGPASTLTAINTAAQDAGYLVSSIALDTADRDTVVQAVDRLSAEGADGIIAIAPQRRVGKRARARPTSTSRWCAGQRPRRRHPRGHRGLHGAGARLATEHLLDLGHRHGLAHRRARPAGPPPTAGPRAGARPWTKAGAEVPEPLVGDWSADSGYELGRRLVGDPDVTAVFASNDQMALGALRAFHEAGRRVPDDVSVVGYDDIPEAAHLLPPAHHHPHRLLLDRHDGAALAVAAVGRAGGDGRRGCAGPRHPCRADRPGQYGGGGVARP